MSVPIYARYHFPLVTDVIARTSFASIVPKRVISGFEGWTSFFFSTCAFFIPSFVRANAREYDSYNVTPETLPIVIFVSSQN